MGSKFATGCATTVAEAEITASLCFLRDRTGIMVAAILSGLLIGLWAAGLPKMYGRTLHLFMRLLSPDDLCMLPGVSSPITRQRLPPWA